MITLRTLILTVFSTILVFGLQAQQPVNKTLAKSFNLQGNDVLVLKLKGDIEVKEWNSPAIRVEMLIGLENGSEMLLKSLIKAGRYNLVAEESEDSFVVAMPGLEREVAVKGLALVDKVSYIVSVPADVIIRKSETTLVEADIDK